MITTSTLLLLPGCSRRAAALLALVGCLQIGHAETAAPAASISELMELGVYSEETKGDLDAAMKLYQQILADTKTNQALAAQALFRLAICHDKKGDLAAASAACERLIKEYPGEKELVAAASDYLADGAALLPAPWQDGEDLDFDLKMPSGIKVGAARYSVDSAERDGRKIWRFSSIVFGGALSASRTEVEAGSMKPIHAVWNVRPVAATETTYANGRAELKLKGMEPRTVECNGIVYDNEEALQLIRRLPLAHGFKKSINVLVAVAGGLIVPVQLEVIGAEKIEVAAGSFACHKVQLTLAGSSQTLWYSTDASRLLVKFEANGVIAELNTIKRNGPDAPVSLREPTLGHSFSAPAGWMARPDGGADQFKRPTYHLVDPAGTAMISVMAEAQKNFDPAQVASVRAYADHQVAMAKKFTEKFEVHPDSWKETTVDGQPALTCVADHVKGPIKLLTLNTFALVEGNAVSITCYIEPENVDSFRPHYETIVASFRGK